MRSEGYIKLHRRLRQSDLWHTLGLVETFVAILLSVNWKTGTFHGVPVSPGQMAFSWRNLGERLFPNAEKPPAVNTLRRRLKKLEAYGVIALEVRGLKIAGKADNECTFLTVPNWSEYQNADAPAYQAVSNFDTPTATPTATPTDTDRRRNKKGKNNSSCPRTSFSDEDMATAKCIWAAIEALSPEGTPPKTPNLDKWANDVRLMRECDGRPLEEIRELFVWANADPFWKTNVLCPAKLREKFDTLAIKRAAAAVEKRNGEPPRGQPPPPRKDLNLI